MKFLKEVFSKENIMRSLALNHFATTRMTKYDVQVFMELYNSTNSSNGSKTEKAA